MNRIGNTRSYCTLGYGGSFLLVKIEKNDSITVKMKPFKQKVEHTGVEPVTSTMRM